MSTFETIYQLSLIGTFLVLIWYTVETAKIRKINTEQKDLQLLPAMMLYIRRPKDDDDDESKHRLVIRNIGSGTAVAVQVLPTTFNIEGKKIEFKFSLADQNSTLVSGEEREIQLEVYRDGESDYHNRYKDFYAYFNPSNLESVGHFKQAKMVREDTPEESDILITFKDIKGQSYQTTIGFRAEGIVVAKPPERVK